MVVTEFLSVSLSFLVKLEFDIPIESDIAAFLVVAALFRPDPFARFVLGRTIYGHINVL